MTANFERREEIVEESGPVVTSTEYGTAVDRREEVQVVRTPGEEYRQQVVQDVGAEQQAMVSRIAAFVWLLTGILEGLLGLRIVLRLIAANPNSPFAQLVYNITGVFVWPFQGLTATPAAGNNVLEISTFFAMVAYALLGWIIVKLLYLVFSPTSSRRVSVYEREVR